MKKNMAFYISIGIAILTLINVYLQKKEQDEKDNEIKAQRVENERLQRELTQSINDKIIGGSNVPEIQIIYRKGGIAIHALNRGQTPVYDFQIELNKESNETIFLRNHSQTSELSNFNSERINLGLNESKSVLSVDFEYVKEMQHELKIRWRNGSVVLVLQLTVDDDGKESNNTVVMFYDNNILTELYKSNIRINYSIIRDWSGRNNYSHPI